MPPKKKRLSNKPEKKQAKVLKLPSTVAPKKGNPAKLVDLIDTSRSGHQNVMPLSKTIDVEKVIKKDKEVKESDVFDLSLTKTKTKPKKDK